MVKYDISRKTLVIPNGFDGANTTIECEEVIEELEDTIKTQEATIKSKDTSIRILNQTINQKNQTITELTARVETAVEEGKEIQAEIDANKLEEGTFTENGTYTPEYGFKSVIVAVSGGSAECEEAIEELENVIAEKDERIEVLDNTVTTLNGEIELRDNEIARLNQEVEDVREESYASGRTEQEEYDLSRLEEKTITANGTYMPEYGYKKVVVNVANEPIEYPDEPITDGYKNALTAVYDPRLLFGRKYYAQILQYESDIDDNQGLAVYYDEILDDCLRTKRNWYASMGYYHNTGNPVKIGPTLYENGGILIGGYFPYDRYKTHSYIQEDDSVIDISHDDASSFIYTPGSTLNMLYNWVGDDFTYYLRPYSGPTYMILYCKLPHEDTSRFNVTYDLSTATHLSPGSAAFLIKDVENCTVKLPVHLQPLLQSGPFQQIVTDNNITITF